LVEMGATHSTVVVTAIETVEAGPVSIGAVHDPALGAYHFDMKLFDHFAAVCLKKDGTKVEPGTKRGTRLLSGCERIRKLLSQLADAKITVENLTDAGDVNFALKRDEMQTICEELLTRFRSLVQAALEKSGTSADQIHAIEIVGGGVRMPSVQNILASFFGSEIALGAKLDDGSVALGAALLSNRSMISTTPSPAPAANEEAAVPDTPPLPPASAVARARRAVEFMGASETVGHTASEIEAARQREEALQVNDAKLVEMHAARNEMESFILEMRSAPRRKHGNNDIS
jgi:molecular chaperone DnaK (HSP70)